ncbi:TPA: hypothetical protein ACGO4F_000198 [Streptococcus suis]
MRLETTEHGTTLLAKPNELKEFIHLSPEDKKQWIIDRIKQLEVQA